MGADKIFVLILSLAFAAFIGYLMWRSRKNESTGNPATSAEPPADAPEAAEPKTSEEPAVGKKARSRSRRK